MKLITEDIKLPVVYTLPLDAVAFRDGLLMESQGIMGVSDAASQNHATAVAREIQAHLGDVEAARVALTAPLLEAQRKLMALKEAHCGPLKLEKDRLGQQVSAFQLAERERVLEEERQRNAEIMRLENERQEALAALERSKQFSISAKTEDDQVIHDMAAGLAEQIKENIEAERRAVIVAPLPEVQKSSGASTKETLDFEVTDIIALVKARPELCKIEAKASAIKAVCKIGDTVPGLRLFLTTKTSFRR